MQNIQMYIVFFQFISSDVWINHLLQIWNSKCISSLLTYSRGDFIIFYYFLLMFIKFCLLIFHFLYLLLFSKNKSEFIDCFHFLLHFVLNLWDLKIVCVIVWILNEALNWWQIWICVLLTLFSEAVDSNWLIKIHNICRSNKIC